MKIDEKLPSGGFAPYSPPGLCPWNPVGGYAPRPPL